MGTFPEAFLSCRVSLAFARLISFLTDLRLLDLCLAYFASPLGFFLPYRVYAYSVRSYLAEMSFDILIS